MAHSDIIFTRDSTRDFAVSDSINPAVLYTDTLSPTTEDDLYNNSGDVIDFQIKSISEDNMDVELDSVSENPNFNYASWRKAIYNANAPKKYIMISEEGYIIYSDDGTTWSNIIINNNLQISDVANNIWVGIVYANSKYVIINSKGYISTSTDGLTWSDPIRPLNTNLTWCAIIHDGTKFIAYSTTARLQTSTDGITWDSSIINMNTGTIYMVDAVYAAGKYVSVDTNANVQVSTDFSTWTNYDSSTNGLSTISGSANSLTYSGSRFYIASKTGKLSISSDGSTWETPTDIDTTQYLNYIGGLVYGSPTANKCFVAETANNTASDRQYLGRLYAITIGTWPSFTKTYTVQAAMEKGGYLNIVSINGKYLAFDGGNKISRSLDGGRTWSLATIPSRPFDINTTWDFFERIINDGTQLVAVSYGGSIYTSIDEGSTWVKQYTGVAAMSTGLCFTGSIYMRLNYTGYYYTSTDLINWSEGTRIASFNGWTDLAWTGTKYIAVTSAGTIAISTDGTNWTVTSGAISIESILTLKYYNGVLYAFGTSTNGRNAYRAYSIDDGETWTVEGPLVGNAALVSSATCFCGDYMLVKASRSNKLLRSVRPDLTQNIE